MTTHDRSSGGPLDQLARAGRAYIWVAAVERGAGLVVYLLLLGVLLHRLAALVADLRWLP